ncbi:hypothetical protein ASG25_10720 [Rhizobium sp. Leaf384]|uniref:hypothetical protein n=1 Tax=Rhizobium sp. Leaf384 TaxID=1736358 RepID=UPI0007130D5F|nr:hypothetical protein [Rhizobium sp. Leaf384]KQS79050.1 hypothetical protein ASG25_10720 [Rhizobium sp. Leaf384]
MSRLEPAIDRFQEAHFWIHSLEKYYHNAEAFRWHLNVFLKAIKEVMPIARHGLQQEQGFKEWFKTHESARSANKLLRKLAKSRDFIVHQGMLGMESYGSVGITEGRGIKLGFNVRIDPLEDSDFAMRNLIYGLAVHGDVFGFLAEDEDSMPCVERHWRLPGIEGDIVDACAKAWLQIGSILSELIEWCGLERPDFNLSCRHSSQNLHFKIYDRRQLRRMLHDFRAEPDFERAADSEDASDLSEDN